MGQLFIKLTIVLAFIGSTAELIAQEGGGGSSFSFKAMEIDYQGALGKRWYINDTNLGENITLQAIQLDNALHWTPMPKFPVSLGMSYSIFDHSEESWQSVDTGSRVTAWEYSIEIEGSHPVSLIDLFFRYRHTLGGEIEIRDKFLIDGSDQVVEAHHDVTGFGFQFGCKYLPPRFSAAITFEYGIGFQNYTPTSITVGTSSDNRISSPNMPEKYQSHSLSVGLELPIYP